MAYRTMPLNSHLMKFLKVEISLHVRSYNKRPTLQRICIVGLHLHLKIYKSHKKDFVLFRLEKTQITIHSTIFTEFIVLKIRATPETLLVSSSNFAIKALFISFFIAEWLTVSLLSNQNSVFEPAMFAGSTTVFAPERFIKKASIYH